MVQIIKLNHKKNSKVYIVQLLLLFSFCYEIPDDYSVLYYPHVVITTSLDTVLTRDAVDSCYHASDTIFAHCSEWQILKVNLADIKRMEFVDTCYRPKGYFDLLPGDTFHICVTGISKKDTSVLPLYDTVNTNMISKKVKANKDNTYNNEYSFKAKSPSKGYITFLENNYDSTCIYSDGRLVCTRHSTGVPKIINICYCIATPEKVNLKIDSLEWSYLLDINGLDTTWYLNRMTLKGKTNAFSMGFLDNRIVSEYHPIQVNNISVNKDGTFTERCREVDVNALKYYGYDNDKMKFDLYIRAFPEPDKKITLFPPKKKKS